MRTWAKALAAATGLVGGVLVYVWWSTPDQPAPDSRRETLRPTTRPLDPAGEVAGIGAGERPWANQYDERGELAYRFRARQYNPLDSGTVEVEAPTFEFFLSGGRRVRLVGERGQVFLPRRSPGRQGGGGDAFGGQASLPSRGTLRNVQIALLEPDSDASSLTAVMDNVIFDNDTLRIWTGESVIEGVAVPGHRIPVIIRGDDYEFDGEGLTIQLAQRGERTIQRVDVARATRLLIKSGRLPGLENLGMQDRRGEAFGMRPKAVEASEPSPPLAPVHVVSASESAAWQAVSGHTVLGQASPGQAVSGQGGRAATESPVRPGGASGGSQSGGGVLRPVADTVYRATFRQGVRIVQGNNTLSGDVLQVDFSSVPRPRPSDDSARDPSSGRQTGGGKEVEGLRDRVQARERGTAPAASPVDGQGSPADGQGSPADGQGSRSHRQGETPAGIAPSQGSALSRPETQEAVVQASPVLVTWDGPLRVEADAGDPRTPPGEAVLSLLAGDRPVELVTAGDAGGSAGGPAGNSSRGGSGGGVVAARAVAAAMTYETATRRVTLQGSTLFPVTLSDDRGSVVTTPLLAYELDHQVAVLTGVSVLRAAADVDEQGRPRQMLASWSRRAVVRFQTPTSPGRSVGRVSSAELTGTVRVDHPELQLSAEQLQLGFEAGPQAGSEGASVATFDGTDLREVLAEGNVLARLPGGGERQGSGGGLQSQSLRLLTTRDADGRVIPSRIEAAGQVVASDGTQRLQARGLVIELKPAESEEAGRGVTGERPGRGVGGVVAGSALARVRPQTLSASGDVLATGADGSQIRAESLTVGNLSGERVVFIDGPNAAVSAEGNTLTADRIIYREADGSAQIPTGGELRGVQRAERPGERDTPFVVVWKDNARLVATEGGGRIDVAGDVRFEAVDRDGAVSTARALQLVVHLTDQAGDGVRSTPQAGGDTQSSVMMRPGQAAQADVPRVRLLGRRQLAGIELAGDVELQSVLADERGSLLRQFNLFSQHVRYDAAGRLEVPGSGRLLLIDRRPRDRGPQASDSGATPDKDAAGGVASAKSAQSGGELTPDGRGNTAMKWDERLVYEPGERRLTFDGAVVFVHEPLSGVADGPARQSQPGTPTTQRYRLDSDRLTVFLEGAGTPRPGGMPGAEQLEQVRTVIAEGQVTFRGEGITLLATELEYVPAMQVVLARGTDRMPVRVEEDRALGVGTFAAARVNLRTGMVEEVLEPRGSVGIGGMPLPAPRRLQGR